ncbi:MAG: hypothetical protein Kow0059_03700 [Candidatus Sumerlaeia bacterium]
MTGPHKKVKVTLVRGLAGKLVRHRRTVWALGLSKPRQCVVHEKTPQIEGMIRSVRHLVKWEDIEE